MVRNVFILLVIQHLMASMVLSSHYVDSNHYNIEEIAEIVCKTNRGSRHLIEKASTITELVDFFMDIESDHKLFDCRKKYMGPLAQLAHVVDSFSDNVCGNDKLGLIETYHRKYISRVRKHLREQKRGGRAPEMGKLFFMEYATEISSICEQAALEAIAQNKHTFSSEDTAKVESLRRFTDSLGMTDLSDGYNGIYLFWNMVDALDLARNNRFSAYLAEDAQIRINVQMKDAKPIKSIQAICHHQLKPIYSISLLPVLRLIDMGYYPHGHELADKLSADPSTRGIFFAAQICETLLPMEVFSEDQLGEEQLVALTKEEASQLTPPQLDGLDEEELAPDKPAMDLIRSPRLGSNQLNHRHGSIDKIKSSVGHRGKVINRLLKQLASHLKSKLLSVFTGFKLFHRSGQDKHLEPISEEPIKEMGPLQINEVEEGQEEGAMRTKRSGFLGECGYVTYLTIYFLFYVLKVIFLIVPTLIALPFILSGRKHLGRIIFHFWKYGDPLDV